MQIAGGLSLAALDGNGSRQLTAVACCAALLASFGDARAPRLDVGIFGTTWVFDVLRAHDLDDVGLLLLNQTTYPSFGRMIAEGDVIAGDHFPIVLDRSSS